MNNLPIFSIIFTDNTCFNGTNNYFDTGWRAAPYKPIKRIFLKLLDNNFLMLQNYEKYNFFVEGTIDWMRVGGKKGIETLKEKPKIEYVYFMGLKNGIVTSYRITMYNGEAGKDKFRMGDFTRREYKLGKEWNGSPTTGWR